MTGVIQTAEPTPRLNGSTWCAPNRETCEERQGPREKLSCQLDQRVRSRIRLRSVVFVAVTRHYSSFPEEQRMLSGVQCRLGNGHLAGTEIDAATLSGRSTNALVSEFPRSAAGCLNDRNPRNWAMSRTRYDSDAVERNFTQGEKLPNSCRSGEKSTSGSRCALPYRGPARGSPFFLALTREYAPEARKALSWRIA